MTNISFSETFLEDCPVKIQLSSILYTVYTLVHDVVSTIHIILVSNHHSPKI